MYLTGAETGLKKFWYFMAVIVFIGTLICGIVFGRTVDRFGNTSFSIWLALCIWIAGAIPGMGCITLGMILENQDAIVTNQARISGQITELQNQIEAKGKAK